MNDTIMNHNASIEGTGSGKTGLVMLDKMEPATPDKTGSAISLLPLPLSLPKPKRVAAYGRISDHRDALLKEKAALIQRFTAIIARYENCQYSGVFIDSGSGHAQLDALLALCRDGSIDSIITPSMNTLSLRRDELYKTLSELKGQGVTIQFENEGLDTAGEGGEALLSTLASFLKPAKPPKPVSVPYGIGDEDEAEVVRRIFSLFLSGHGRTPIAKALNAAQIPPPRLDIKVDASAWTYCDVKRILDNPIYAKEGIIPTEIWERTVAESSRRNASYGYRTPSDSPLRGMITCGVCGDHYTRRERGTSSLWLCKTYLRGSRAACPSRGIREKVLLRLLEQTVSGTENVDNITVWPDGRLAIHTATDEIERTWR